MTGVCFSYGDALGVFAGAVIATLSFQILKWQLKKAFHNPNRIPGKGRVFITYYLRFLGVFFLVFAAMYHEWVTPVPFLVGLSVVVFSILIGGGLEVLAWSAKKGER